MGIFKERLKYDYLMMGKPGVFPSWYQREVNRFHFFTTTFNKADIKQLLNTGNIEVIDSLKNSYLGFITIKKLPDCRIKRDKKALHCFAGLK